MRRRFPITPSPANTCSFLEYTMLLQKIELRELRMQLVHPFQTSFGTTLERRILIVKVNDGVHFGFGEVTAGEGPFYSHETWQTAWHILEDFIIPRAIGIELDSAKGMESILAGIRGHRMAQAGLETAVWDMEARTANSPLWKFLGGVRAAIECGVSIGIEPTI